MPRPGQRPFECVRRAWHSDRHQPIRGSLIKEIFRVANEIHGSSTKQNKEWQEKLPTVVLKAEEIMYSKANSEAEYMDLKTLWDRTNDAINTIIRRDESLESGVCLQPCIEAALNLGCTPRRASRSQRNCHPGSYLSPKTTDVDNVAKCSNLVRPPSHLGSVPRSPFAQNSITAAMKLVSAPESAPKPNFEKLLPISNTPAAKNSFAAYPLYYGKVPQINTICPVPALLPRPVCDVLEPVKGCLAPKNVPFHEDCRAKNQESSVGDTRIACDLSLRLGPVSAKVPSPSVVKNKQPKEVTSEGGGKFCCDRLPKLDKGFSFFPRGNVLELYGSHKSMESDATMRKRKAVFDPLMMEDQRYYLQPKLPFRNLTGL